MGNSQLDAIEEMALQNGTYIVNDATEYTNDIDAIYVAEDTIFASIKIGNYISTPASTIKAGVIIAPVRGVSFSGVQLTSGSIVAILK